MDQPEHGGNHGKEKEKTTSAFFLPTHHRSRSPTALLTLERRLGTSQFLHLVTRTSTVSSAPILCSLLMESLIDSSDGGCRSLPRTSCNMAKKATRFLKVHMCKWTRGRQGGLKISALNSGSSGLGSSPDRGSLCFVLG